MFDLLVRLGADPTKLDPTQIHTQFLATILVDEYKLDHRKITCDAYSSDEFMDWVIERPTTLSGSTLFADARKGGIGPPLSVELTAARADITLRDAVRHAIKMFFATNKEFPDSFQVESRRWIEFVKPFINR